MGRAPAGGGQDVQTYVSQLRKALGDGVVATRGHAYVLERDAGSVDAERFGALVADGRKLLDAGAPGRAADRLRAALELWRGPALADVAYEAPSQGERSPAWRSCESARPRIGSRPRSRPGGRASWSPSSRRWRASTRYASGCAAS